VVPLANALVDTNDSAWGGQALGEGYAAVAVMTLAAVAAVALPTRTPADNV
jgi:hypothetical protein